MEHETFIVRHDGKYHGPFLSYETELFRSKLEGESEVIPLFVPRLPDEERGPTELHLMEADDYRAHVDSFKVDTNQMLSGIIQGFYFARRDERVLTARELNQLWSDLFRISRAIESLMHWVEKAIAEPNSDNLESLRKAFWRNRDSDDVDPHYADRFG